MQVNIKKLYEGVILPEYKTKGSAGCDIHAFIGPQGNYIRLMSGEIRLVKCGFSLEIPKGYEVQIRPRSGLAKLGVTVMNAPGTIDSDYRGEVGVLLINLGEKEITIEKNERIAQMVCSKVEQMSLETVTSMCDTKRGSGGFGSTGRV